MTVPRSALRRLSDQRGWSNPPWLQIVRLARADGWTALYDPSNPHTRTLREDNGDLFIEEIADGLGNLPAAVQATAVDQPQLRHGFFGALDAGDYSDIGTPRRLQTSSDAFTHSQPNFQIAVAKSSTTSGTRIITDRSGTGGRNILYHTSLGFTMAAGVVLQGGETNTNPTIHGGLFNGASSERYENSALTASGDAGTESLGGLTLGTNTTGGGVWSGEIGIVLLFDGDPGADKRTRMFDLLHSLTGIPKAA